MVLKLNTPKSSPRQQNLLWLWHHSRRPMAVNLLSLLRPCRVGVTWVSEVRGSHPFQPCNCFLNFLFYIFFIKLHSSIPPLRENGQAHFLHWVLAIDKLNLLLGLFRCSGWSPYRLSLIWISIYSEVVPKLGQFDTIQPHLTNTILWYSVTNTVLWYAVCFFFSCFSITKLSLYFKPL